MTRQVYQRKSISAGKRKFILERDNQTCVYCGEKADQIDHVDPVCRGGSDDESNLVSSCRSCNAKANGMKFASFDKKKAFILDPDTKAPSVLTMKSASAGRRGKNHPWRRPINSKKLPPSGKFDSQK